MKEECLSFDSGRIIKPSALYTNDGKSEAVATQKRSIYEFNDELKLRKFDVEVIFQDMKVLAVLLYPKDVNKGGYETPREKMESSAKEIERWFKKNLSDSCNATVHGEFDPRSWCSYAVLKFM